MNDNNCNTTMNFLQNLFFENKPIVKLFRTQKNNYIYDSGTNKIIQCNKDEYNFIKSLLDINNRKGLREYIASVDKMFVQNLFQCIKKLYDKDNIFKLTNNSVDRFESYRHFRELKKSITKGLRHITLELTEQCNLKCKYCIYNSHVEDMRNFGVRDMSFDIAKKSVDYLFENNSEADIAAVGFYGGEPLLRFELLKRIVDYTLQKDRNRKVTFSITTNLTLVTEEIARYFANVPNLSVVGSIDGPEDIHNRYRVYRDGRGSFRRAIQGLKFLFTEFGEKNWQKISLSMVYAPPYTAEKLERINNMHKEIPWLPSNTMKRITYPHKGSIPSNFNKIEKNGIGKNKSLDEWAEDTFFSRITNKSDHGPLVDDMIIKRLLYIHKRKIYNKVPSVIKFNGNCVPGSRKLYVTATGDFRVCEKIQDSPMIGNVECGVDINKVREIFIRQYAKESISWCKNCWAAKLCDICYVQAFDSGKFDLDKKLHSCSVKKGMIKNDLRLYYSIYETNKDSLSFLNDVVVT